MVYNPRKLRELILYVADRLRTDRYGGATKLNKVLYFADFAHMRLYGAPITGADYQKLEHGPAPRALKPLRAELLRSGDAKLEEEIFLGYTSKRLVPTIEADLSVFDELELKTIDQVLRDLEGLTARQVSDLSHEELGWQLVDYYETIPYHTAILRKPDRLTPAVSRRVAAVAEKLNLKAVG